MWPFWSLHTISEHLGTFVQWTAGIGAIIAAILMAISCVVSIWYKEYGRKRFEPMSALEFAFLFPFTIVLGVVFGVPVGALFGWIVGCIIGAITIYAGIILVSIGIISGLAYHMYERRSQSMVIN